MAAEQDLADAQVDVKVQQLLERLHQDKLVVAFVAEFSRGKSELINAIFFADFGQRILPSSRRPHDDVPDRAAATTPTRRRRSGCCRSRRAPGDESRRRVQELRRRVGDDPRSTVLGGPDGRGAVAACADQARPREARRASTACYDDGRPADDPSAPTPARRQSRAGATRSSTSRTRCCSRVW